MEAELPAKHSQRDFGNENNRCKKTKETSFPESNIGTGGISKAFLRHITKTD